MAHKKAIDLAWNADGVPTMVRGDQLRIRQVLINLVGNGLKFTQEGAVSVLAKMATNTKSGMRVHFTISDTGIGIPLDKQRRIFEAFAQADMSISRRYGGTGLGLSISERLVKLMGGRIWLESDPGHGSKFHFEIPLLPSMTPGALGPGEPDSDGGTRPRAHCGQQPRKSRALKSSYAWLGNGTDGCG